MSNRIDYQSQQIPAYSGITINITSPTLNAGSLPGYGGNNGNYNAVGINVAQEQQRQANEGYMTYPNYQSPNGYYAQQDIKNSYADNKLLDQSNSSTDKEIIKETVRTEEKIINNSNEAVQGNYGYETRYAQVPQMNNQDRVAPQQDAVAAYPQNYYINNYNNPAQNSEPSKAQNGASAQSQNEPVQPQYNNYIQAQYAAPVQPQNNEAIQSQYSNYAQTQNGVPAQYQYQAPAQSANATEYGDAENDLRVSEQIVQNIESQRAEEQKEHTNMKKVRVIALTNEYIMSLENYLNNPNVEIRLMAAKDILARLDEDRDRYDDAALNALLNKMLQDPSKLVRIAALSALSSDLASGNDYTVQLLTQIQQNPNSDQQDVIEVSKILLNRSSGREIRYVPVKETKTSQKQKEPKTWIK